MSQINKEGFELSSYEPLEISLPGALSATDADVDAQLFEYVSNASRHSRIRSLQDLDDEWVSETFPNMSTIAELREHIKTELNREYNRERANGKYEACMEALVARVQGELPEGYVDENIAAASKLYEQRLNSFGMTKAKYMDKEKLTEEEFIQKMRDDIAFKAKYDVAVELLVDHYGVTVEEDEITQYLSCEDPATYVDELKASGNLEGAKHAAAKVKIMRRVMDEAVVRAE